MLAYLDNYARPPLPYCPPRVAFWTVLESMGGIGFSSDEIDQVQTLLAAVLHLGDIVSH